MSHVAFIVPTLDRIAGAERQVLLLAAGFSKRGWRVSVVALSAVGGKAAEDLCAAGAQYLGLGMRKGLADPRGWIKFHRWLRRETPDVVHAHLPHAAWLARWSRLGAATPVLIDTVHTSSTGTLGRRLGYRLSRWLPDQVSAVSGGVAKAYRSAGMIAANRLLVIPNGVDVEHWRPDSAVRKELRRQLGYTNEFLWLAAGRLDPVKDYPTLLRAMRDVPKPACLLIAGAGPEDGALRDLVIRLGLELRIRFLGFQTDVLPWMQCADAFVLTSRWEGLPMSLLEAGACALPSVATDVPGSREIVVDSETGFLAPAGNSLTLLSAMTRLMRLDHDARSAMGKHARRNVVTQFSLDSVLDRWEAVYLDLLDQHGHCDYRAPAIAAAAKCHFAINNSSPAADDASAPAKER